MIPIQNTVIKNVVDPGSIATTTSSAAFDCLNARHATILYRVAPVTAATSTAQMATLEILESDGTSAAISNASLIAAFTGTTATVTTSTAQFLISAGNSGTGLLYKFDINMLPPRKRFLYVRQAAGSTNDRVVSSVAILSRLNDTPVNASEAGVSVLQIG